MNLRVGPFVYRVQFVEGLIEHEGRQCLGLCDNDAHVILVARHGNEAQQIQVVCHEYMEAWVYHFGQGMQDKEAMCDLFGMAMTQFTLDLMHQMRCWADPAPVTEESHAAFPETPGPSFPGAEKDLMAKGILREYGSLAGEAVQNTQRQTHTNDARKQRGTERRPEPDESVGLKLRGSWSVRGLGEEGGWRIRLVEPSGEARGMRRVS